MVHGGESVRVFLACCWLLIAAHSGSGQSLSVGPNLRFTANADSPVLPAPQEIGIGVIGADKLEFKFLRVLPALDGGPNFVVVSPSSGVAPTRIGVALNPNVVPYLASGSYALSISFATAQSSSPAAGISVFLTLNGVPQPSVSAVVSSATLQTAISPGEVVSIFGTNLSTLPVTAQFDSAGLYPTDLSHTRYEGTDIRDGVTFNGFAAPLLYVSTGQINAQVPYQVAGQKTVNVVVTHNLRASPPFAVPITDTSPGVFTVTGNGNGQGAILDADTQTPSVVTVNSVENPAAKGSAISIYATGSGLWSRAFQDGSIFLIQLAPPIVPAAPVSLTIGGQPARILYAGAAPFLISGVFQVNAIVPDGIGSGPQPLVLTVGQNSNAPQQVTVAVQ